MTTQESIWHHEDETPSAPALSGRTRARMLAMQALYELDATSHEPSLVLRRRVEEDHAPADVAEYARSLVSGVREHQADLDARIAAAAPAWPLDQLARVDKAILRVGVYELLFERGVPGKVAINEAVEMAKTFGHETSSKFVNGVLGTIERSRPRPPATPAATTTPDPDTQAPPGAALDAEAEPAGADRIPPSPQSEPAHYSQDAQSHNPRTRTVPLVRSDTPNHSQDCQSHNPRTEEKP